MRNAKDWQELAILADDANKLVNERLNELFDRVENKTLIIEITRKILEEFKTDVVEKINQLSKKIDDSHECLYGKKDNGKSRVGIFERIESHEERIKFMEEVCKTFKNIEQEIVSSIKFEQRVKGWWDFIKNLSVILLAAGVIYSLIKEIASFF
jgi:hypothetical protein